MNGRTSKSAIVARAFIVGFVISLGLGGLWNMATGTAFWTFGALALGSLFIVCGFGLFGWIIVNVGTRLFCGRDPDFQNYVRNGGDPYFDTLPSPMNPDSEVTRVTGLQEPENSKGVPKSWVYQCPVCGCRQPSRVCVCWNPECRYGADGDSTAYYKRWGHLGKPAAVTDELWHESNGR